MANITTDISIQRFGTKIHTHLYFPTDLPDAVGNKVKGVIWLLHGHSQNASGWPTMSSAYRYAADNGYVLICPSVGNSFYTDMAYGQPWFTMLTQDLPEQLSRIFNIPQGRDITHIAGLSMGGYGALRIGLTYPERFATIGSFSGVVDIAALLQDNIDAGALSPELKAVWGDKLELPLEHDNFALARKVAALPFEEQPRILLTCGRQDEITSIPPMNRRFTQLAEQLDLQLEYRKWDGKHEWNVWDRSFAEFIGFLQSSSYTDRKKADWAGY